MAHTSGLRAFPLQLRIAALVSLILLAGAAEGAEFRILLDLDNTIATGCTANTAAGPFQGIEQILITTTTPTGPNSGDVTAVAVETCSSGLFGVPVAVTPPPPSWPVGVDLGDAAADVVETYLPNSLLAAVNPAAVRIVVVGSEGQEADAAGPVVVVLAQIAEIPTLDRLSLLMLAALLVGAAVLVLRRGGAAILALVLLLAGASAAWALVTLDGSPLDWSSANRVVDDPTGDGPVGAPDIESVFVREDTCNSVPGLCFRIDAHLIFNQPPLANDDSATVVEDSGANTIDVLANDVDPDGPPFSIASVTQPANGTVVITNGGTDLTYAPNANYCNNPPGTTLDTFTYILGPVGDTATVTVTVNCVADNPTAVNDAATVGEDSGANTIDVQANDTDPDNVGSITAVTQPANGTVVITNGGADLTYTPDAGYCNTPPGTTLDTFTYTLSPGGSVGTVTVTVTCIDDAPTAVNDAATVNEDSGANTINVLANDTDTDAGPISIQSVTQPANGAVVITNAGADLTYAPNANYCNNPPGTTLDTFTYTLNGGSSATVTMTVTCVDDDPTAVADAATVAEDSGASTIDVLANDTDPDGGAISITSVTQPANGTVVITNGGADLTYAPNANYCNNPPGTTLDTFTYTLTPGGSIATVTVTVTCLDDNPTAVDDSATVAEDSGANPINVQSNDTDPDGGTNTIQSVTQPANGAVVITNGGADLTYAPNANYCNNPPGTTLDTFTYTLTPGGSTATVTVTVNCADDPPLAVVDSATVNEDSGANAINVLANDTDLDAGPISILSVTQPGNGAVVITNGGADLTYAPNANYCNNPPGTTLDTFTYTLTPGGSSTTVTVTVTCLNDGPVLDLDADDDKGTGGANFAVTFTEGDTVKLLEDPVDATVSDVDSANIQTLTVTLTNLLDPTFETLDADLTGFPSISKNYDTTTPGVGILTVTGPDLVANFQSVLRTVTYLNTDQDPDATARTVTFVANDGISNGNIATATVTVVPVDVAPTAVNDSATVNEDSGANTIDVQANDTDPDGGPISITSVTQPANGTVVITNAGADLTYAPNANYCNSVSGPVDSFTYTLTPGGSTTTVSVTVTCVDDNPTAVADAATVVEDSGANTINVLANDTDPDGGPKSITSVTQPANGTVVITNGGADLTYAPNANYCNNPPGTTLDTFTYTLTPGGSSTTVTMTVTCVDDNPVAVADAATVTEDSGANAINVLANDTDPDGGPISITSVTQPANGAVVITNGGADLTYAPNANYCNTPPGTTLDTFTYTLTPGGSSTTVTMTVTCIDDPPTAVADAATVNEDSGANAIDVLANDTDIDAGPKSVTSVTQPANGTVVNNGTNVTYAPNANYCNNPPGTTLDSFTYTLTPGGSATTVTVTVTCINDPPLADDDVFDFIGNTQLEVDQDSAPTPETLETTPTTFGVLDGDSDPVENDSFAVSSITVGACTDNTLPTFDCIDPGVGTVNMQSNGRFSFVPAAGDTSGVPAGCPVGTVGGETFTYVVTDTGTPPAGTTATVTLCRFERVWYVDPNAGGGGNGTSALPFNTLDSLDGGADSDVAGDYIFVHDGTLALSGPMPMENNQHLVGEGHVAVTVPSNFALSIPVNLNGNGSPTNLVASGTHPQLTNATGNAVNVTTEIPIEIVGLSLASTTGNAIDQTSTAALTGSTTLTISSVVFRGAGAEGVDFNLNAGTTGTLNLIFTNNSWDLAGTHPGNAFDARTAAAGAILRLNFSNNTPILSTGAGTTAVFVDGSGGGAVTVTGFANNTVHQNSVGSGVFVGAATFDGTAGAPFNQVAGGTTVIGASGNGVGAGGMTLSNVSGDLAFTDLDIFADGGAAFTLTGTGAVNTGAGTGTRVTVAAGVGIFEATGGPAVSANSATVDLQLSSLKSTNTATKGVSLVSVSDAISPASNAAFSAGGGSTITTTAGATGPIFEVSGGDADIAYAGTIVNSGTAARAVSLTTWNGDDGTDDITLSGAITENGAGILVNGNAGSRPINFTGGMTINTSTGEGFAATSNTTTGGLHITGTNDITSTSATALRVTNTTIGSSNLNFRKVSSGNNTAAADPASGIVLNTTGSLGRLIVAGNGGSCTSLATCTGGAIQNMTSHGISLASTLNPSFTRMAIQNTAGSGIDGTGVNGFTLQNSFIDNSGTGGGADESNLAFDVQAAGTETNLSGVVTIINNTLTNARYHGVRILNFNGTISNLNISSNTITSSTAVASSLGSGIHLQFIGSSTTVSNLTMATIANNVITNFPSDAGIEVKGGNSTAAGTGGTMGTPGSGTNVVSITGNLIAGQSAANRMGTMAIDTGVSGGNSGSRSQANFDISSNGTVANPISNMAGIAIGVANTGYATTTYTVNNNVIVANNTVASGGIAGGNGIVSATAETPDMTITANNNNISATDGNGILLVGRGVTGILKAKIQNNTVGAPLTGVRPGIRVDAGNASSVDDAVCVNISGNTSAGSGGTQGIGLRKQGTTSTINDFGIHNLPGGSTATPNVEAYVNGLNPAGGGTLLISATSGFSTCSFP